MNPALVSGSTTRLEQLPPLVAAVAVISYRHAYELVTTRGETGLTTQAAAFTVDGLILATSMLILNASRRHHPRTTTGALVPGRRLAAAIGAPRRARPARAARSPGPTESQIALSA